MKATLEFWVLSLIQYTQRIYVIVLTRSLTRYAVFTAVGIACYSDGCICHDRIRPSVRLSVRPSVTFRCFVETNEATIMRFSPTGRVIILVSGEVKIVWKFAGDHP